MFRLRQSGQPLAAEGLSAVVCLFIAAVLYLGPYLWRDDLFNNDAAHHVFWLYTYADTTLFPGDVTVPYFQTSAPWGYRALYAGISPITDVFRAAEWMSVPLLFLCGWLAWGIGKACEEHGAGGGGLLTVLALILLLPLSEQRDLLPPIAFQRTFAFPLLLLTLWALIRRRYQWVGISWLLAALLYPVVLPVQGLTAAAMFLREVVRDRQMPAHWGFNLAIGVVALAVAAYGIPVPPEIGPAYTYEQAIKMPEFGPGGRLQLYDQGLGGNLLRDHRTGLGWSAGDILIITLSLMLAWRLGKIRRIPLVAWVMAAVGVGLWAAMRLFPDELMFGLYLPNRHSRWAIGAFGMLTLAAGSAAVYERLVAALDRNESGPPGSAGHKWLAALAPVLVTIVLLPQAIDLARRPVDQDLENVYRFIETLPKSTLIAAHPDLADFVPVRARRSVLTSTEVSMAWMEGYYAMMKPRVEASLRAAYAVRIEDVDAVLKPYGVDVMLSGPSVWKKEGYFAPFDVLAKELIERGTQLGFVLQAPPSERVLFQSGDYYVVRVAKCYSADCL
jgi:hypothetical protein